MNEEALREEELRNNGFRLREQGRYCGGLMESAVRRSRLDSGAPKAKVTMLVVVLLLSTFNFVIASGTHESVSCRSHDGVSLMAPAASSGGEDGGGVLASLPQRLASPPSSIALTLVWSYTSGDEIHSKPCVDSGVVFVGSLDCRIYALNASSGELIWSYKTQAPVMSSSPVVEGGALIVGSGDKLYALNKSNGELVWSTGFNGTVTCRPAVSSGVVFTGNTDHTIYALNASTGEILWSYETGSYVRSPPVAAGGVVFVGSFDKKIYALNTSTGEVIWSYETGSYIVDSSPSLDDGMVFTESDDHSVYALNESNGNLIWRYDTGSQLDSSPVTSGGIVFISIRGNDMLYALNETSGELIWVKDIGASSSEPTVAYGILFIAGSYMIVGLDVSTGDVVCSCDAPYGFASPLTVAGDMVFVGGGDFKLYAFRITENQQEDQQSVSWQTILVAALILMPVGIVVAAWLVASLKSLFSPTTLLGNGSKKESAETQHFVDAREGSREG